MLVKKIDRVTERVRMRRKIEGLSQETEDGVSS